MEIECVHVNRFHVRMPTYGNIHFKSYHELKEMAWNGGAGYCGLFRCIIRSNINKQKPLKHFIHKKSGQNCMGHRLWMPQTNTGPSSSPYVAR